MEIPKKLLKEWGRYKSSGDAVKIAEQAGVSSMTIYNAFRDGFCNDEVFEAIASYYKEKKERIENILSDFQN